MKSTVLLASSISSIAIQTSAYLTGYDDQYSYLYALPPNTTSSTTFPGLGYNDTTWTWQINITNARSPRNTSIEDLAVTWSLQWPGGNTLESWYSTYVKPYEISTPRAPNIPLCMNVWSLSMPSNVTKRYIASDNGNCSRVLGDRCAASLEDRMNLGYNGTNCNMPFLTSLDGCEDTLDVASRPIYGIGLCGFLFYYIHSTDSD